ncbi:hypothetical protein O1L55_08110 [Streptomyces albulus]|nr:hypothetical protein [Streptomyces noursei]
MRAVQIKNFGGPEVLELAEVADPLPAPGEVLVEVSLAGVNYRDTHLSEVGALPGDLLPLIPGMEVVGRTPTARASPRSCRAADTPNASPSPPSWPSRSPTPSTTSPPSPSWCRAPRPGCCSTRRPDARGDSVLVHAAAGSGQPGRPTGPDRRRRTGDRRRRLAQKRALALDLGADEAIDSTTPTWRPPRSAPTAAGAWTSSWR